MFSLSFPCAFFVRVEENSNSCWRWFERNVLVRLWANLSTIQFLKQPPTAPVGDNLGRHTYAYTVWLATKFDGVTSWAKSRFNVSLRLTHRELRAVCVGLCVYTDRAVSKQQYALLTRQLHIIHRVSKTWTPVTFWHNFTDTALMIVGLILGTENLNFIIF